MNPRVGRVSILNAAADKMPALRLTHFTRFQTSFQGLPMPLRVSVSPSTLKKIKYSHPSGSRQR
jgi:hypothetical protein